MDLQQKKNIGAHRAARPVPYTCETPRAPGFYGGGLIPVACGEGGLPIGTQAPCRSDATFERTK